MTDNRTNTLFPGRPNYTGPTKGYFSLLHHQVQFEESHNVMERVTYIKKYKRPKEIATRLHNIMYLDPKLCPAISKLAPLDADHKAKLDTLDAEILDYIRVAIPDCAWNGRELVFP